MSYPQQGHDTPVFDANRASTTQADQELTGVRRERSQSPQQDEAVEQHDVIGKETRAPHAHVVPSDNSSVGQIQPAMPKSPLQERQDELKCVLNETSGNDTKTTSAKSPQLASHQPPEHQSPPSLAPSVEPAPRMRFRSVDVPAYTPTGSGFPMPAYTAHFWSAEDSDSDALMAEARADGGLDDYRVERVEEAEYESSSGSDEEGDSDEGDEDVAKEGVDKDEAIASSETQRKA